MRFLSGADIQANVKQLACPSGAVMAVVAYWGQGAVRRTGLAENDQPFDHREFLVVIIVATS